MNVSVELDKLNFQHGQLNSLLQYLEIQHADKLIECLTIYYALNNRLDLTIENPALPGRFELTPAKTAINNAFVKLNELKERLTQENIPALQELNDKYGSITTNLLQLKAQSDIFLQRRKERLRESRLGVGGSRRRKRLKRSRRKTRR